MQDCNSPPEKGKFGILSSDMACAATVAITCCHYARALFLFRALHQGNIANLFLLLTPHTNHLLFGL
ncbi:MAG TPA: hypothetical protein DEA46_04340 [Candidatus Moranbacteria bacterium]|nr:hypothetical protein [Candidatus Moranbacteria bacterium]